MKTIILTALTILSLSAHAATSDKLETKYSVQGYPYNLLINRSDSIKILFTENTKNVNCIVEFSDGDIVHRTAYSTVSKVAFDKQPLVSCLSRKQAKTWLKETF